MTGSHNDRSVHYAVSVAVRLCWCGRPARKHAFFCGDECRFWSKVQKGPGCWLWTASIKDNGYGQFTTWDGERQIHVGAHVFSYCLAHGPIEAGVHVCHRCDTPPCVRPDHLFPGDHKANMEDASKKGRLCAPHPRRHKISTADIYELRRLSAQGVTGVLLAVRYGVTEAHVSRLIKGTARQYDAPLPSAALSQRAG